MVSPSRRREAVLVIQDRLKLSERRACEIVGQPRSTQRYEPKVAADDQLLRRELRRTSAEHKRWGHRRAHGHLVNECGWRVNRKRVQRIWREEDLRVPPKPKKRRRVGNSSDELPERATYPGHVWALESFNARFRDEVLDCELFSSILEARVIADVWRDTYNRCHPHSSLGMLAPAVFAERWRADRTEGVAMS